MKKINRRSIYLINPPFQLKVAFFISTLVMLLGLVYPLIIYELIRQLVEHTGMQQTYQALSENRTTFIGILGVIHSIFFVITFIICIFQAHKIAGPMYHLKKYLDEITMGRQITFLTFRKHDHFKEVASAINGTFNSFAEAQKQNQIVVNHIKEQIKELANSIPHDKKLVIEDIEKQLSSIK